MTRSLRAALAASLLFLPTLVSAQPAPPPPPPFPSNAVEDDGMWVDDDLMALGLFEDFLFDEQEDLEGLDDGGLAGPAGAVDGVERRVVTRRIGGPGMAGRELEVHVSPGMGHTRGQVRGRMGMVRRHGMALRLARLDLTDAQRDRMRGIHEAQRRKDIQRRADLQLAAMDLNKLMRAEKADPVAVNAQIDKLSRLRADAMKSRFDTRQQALAVLTPEQLKRLREGEARGGGPGAPGRGPGGPDGPGRGPGPGGPGGGWH
ncbi:MAG: Spy/CpxP family protein refolding chaperone [bacterium]